MTALYLAALLLALIDQAIARGRSIVGWAVILVCIGLLWVDLARLL